VPFSWQPSHSRDAATTRFSRVRGCSPLAPREETCPSFRSLRELIFALQLAPRVDPPPAHNLQPLNDFYDYPAVLSSDGSGSLTSRSQGLKHGLSNQAGRGTAHGTPTRGRASWAFLNHPGVSDGAGR